MPFDADTLSNARKSGYSDDDIYEHLGQTDPRFAQAKAAGYSLDDVAAHFAPQQQEKDFFASSELPKDRSIEKFLTPSEEKSQVFTPEGEREYKGPTGEWETLGPETKAHMDAPTAPSDTPGLFLPKPDVTGPVTGILSGAVSTAEQLTTPKNLGLMLAIGGAPRAIQRAASVAFGAQMIKHLPEQISETVQAKGAGETAKAATETVLGAAMALLAAKHGLGSERAAVDASRTAGLNEDQVNKLNTQLQLKGLAPETTPETPSHTFTSDEIVDGLNYSKDALLKDFATQPKEVQQKRQALIDTIDEQLLNIPKEQVNESRSRIEELRQQRQQAGAPDRATEGLSVVPRTEGGTSDLFRKAQAEAAAAVEPLRQSAEQAKETLPNASAAAEQLAQAIEQKRSEVDAPLPEWMKSNAEAAVNSLTNEQRSQLESLAANGKTAKEIAATLGIDETTLREARVGLGIPSQTIGAIGTQQINPDFIAWREEYLKRSPSGAQTAKVTPAIETPQGEITTGEDHVKAYEKAKEETPDTSGSKEGFVDNKTGEFLSREEAADKTGLETNVEEGKLHSSDLTETKEPVAVEQPVLPQDRVDENAAGTGNELETPPASKTPLLDELEKWTAEEEAPKSDAQKRVDAIRQDIENNPDASTAWKARRRKELKAAESALSQEQEDTTEQPVSDAAPAEPQRTEQWQKTREQIKEEGGSLSAHRLAVRKAIAEGQQVPLDVLEGFSGSDWADTARRKLYGEDVSESLFQKIINDLKDDPSELLSDPLLIKTLGKPVVRGMVQLMREGIEAGKLAGDVIQDVVSYLTKSSGGKLSEDQAKQIAKPLLEEYEKALNETKASSQQQGVEADQARQDQGASETAGEEAKPEVQRVEDTQRLTSTKNEVMEAERKARGVEPIDAPVRQSIGEVWDKAGDKLEENTEAGRELVKRTIDNPSGPISTEEEAVMLRYKVRLQNDIAREIERASDESLPLGDRQEARVRSAALLDENNELDQATRARGTVWGRLGRFRQQLAAEDYTLPSMLQRARVANGGAELSQSRIEQITAQSKEISELKAKIEKLEQERDSIRAEKAATDAVAEMAKKAKPPKEKAPESAKAPLSKSVTDFVNSQMDAARRRIAERRGKTFADPLGVMAAGDLADHAIIGAGYLVKGSLNFGKWSAAMLQDLGEEIKPYLRQIYKAAKEQRSELLKSAPRDIESERKATAETIGNWMKAGDQLPELQRHVQKLAEQFVSQGVTERDALIDAVHGVLKEINPDITRRQTMDAISGYGDSKALNKDEIKTQLRDLKGQMQQVGKIEDMQAGQAPKKTGVERRTPSDEERRLVQQVNELKKLGGYEVKDPATQLKSSLDAIKTRLRNQIRDLDYQISTKERIVRDKTETPTDTEADALRAQRDAKKAEFQSIFGRKELTDEQRVKIAARALEKSIKDYESRIEKAKKGEFPKEEPSKTPKTAELSALQSRRDALRSELQDLKDSDSALQEQKRVRSIQTQIDALREQVKSGDVAPEPKGQTVDSAGIAKLKTEREQLVKQREEMRKGTPEQREAAKLEKLQTRIAELEKKITEGDIATKPKESTAPTKEVAEAQQRIEQLQKQMEEMRNGPKKTPDERALSAYKSRTANRIAELEERLSKEDFAPKPKNAPIQLDAEAQKLQAKMEKVKLEYDRANMKDQLARRSATEKILDFFPKMSRAFLLSNPITLAKLGAAALYRMGVTPIEEAIGSGLRQVPGLSSIAERAPRQGGGLNLQAETRALTEGTMRGMKDAYDLLRKGETDLETVAGKRNIMPHEWMDFFGHIHGAMKSITKRNEFERSLQQRAEFNARNGVDITDPLVQTRMMAEAYKDAERSIFQQNNAIVSRYNRFVRSLEEKSKETGRTPLGSKILQSSLKTLFPIVKVPTNIVAEAFDYALGSAIGSARAVRALRNGVETLGPEEADLIMRQLKKGSLGGAVMTLGFLAPQVIGGYYQQGQRRKESDVKPGRINLYGTEIPNYLLHAPVLEMLQVGSTIRRVADSKLKKHDKDSQGIPMGILAGAVGLTEEVPFVRETLTDLPKVLNTNERQQFFGELARSRLEPQLLQWIAQYTDLQNGKPVERKPETVSQYMQSGIPGLRQGVPRKKRSRAWQ